MAETFHDDGNLSWWREEMQILHLPSHQVRGEGNMDAQGRRSLHSKEYQSPPYLDQGFVQLTEQDHFEELAVNGSKKGLGLARIPRRLLLEGVELVRH